MSRVTSLSEKRAERELDREDLEGGPPIPAVCGGCGARILQHTSPTVWKADLDGRTVHACRRRKRVVR